VPRLAAGVPSAWNFIQVASVATHPNGNILVLHRGAHPLMEFEPSGKFVRTWDNIAFSEGKTGRFFTEFALTVAAAVIVSGFVALTLTPMMCSRILQAHESHGRVYLAMERFWPWWRRWEEERNQCCIIISRLLFVGECFHRGRKSSPF
jgi:hypothetical protein